MSGPLVNILVPTYGRAAFLRLAVESALVQTHADLEVLILDDASPDDTPEVGAELAARDPRVTYVRRPKNLGIAENWRDGFARVRGEFFCILHDDDRFEPTFVESLLRPMLDRPGLTLAFCDQSVISPDGTRLNDDADVMSARFRRDRLPAGLVNDLLRVAMVDQSLPVGASLFRRSACGPELIDGRAKGAIDYWLFYQLVRRGAEAWYVPQRLMEYRTHPGSMSGGRPTYMAEGHLFRLDAALADEAMRRIWPDLRRQRADVLTSYGLALLRGGRPAAAAAQLFAALRQRFGRRAAVGLALSAAGPVGVRLARRLSRTGAA